MSIEKETSPAEPEQLTTLRSNAMGIATPHLYYAKQSRAEAFTNSCSSSETSRWKGFVSKIITPFFSVPYYTELNGGFLHCFLLISSHIKKL